MTIAPSNLADMVADLEIEDAPDGDGDLAPDGFACVVCGVDVSHLYKRRVKEPRCEEHKKTPGAKNASSGRRSSKDVDAAVSSLSQVYTLMEAALTMAQLPLARMALSESVPKLNASNREHLNNDPELARRIASMGKTGGRYAFFTSQALVIGPVLFLAFSELNSKREAKQSETPGWSESDIPATGPGGFPLA